MISLWSFSPEAGKNILLGAFTHSAEELLPCVPLDDESYHTYQGLGSNSRKIEFLGSRYLINLFFQRPIILGHESSGKPFLINAKKHISISHSNHYVAIYLTDEPNPGIDIELMHRPIHRILSRFLSPAEQNNLLAGYEKEHALVCWTMKEVMVKSLQNRQIDFQKELSIQAFNPIKDREARIIVTQTSESVERRVSFFQHENLWISHT